MLIPAHGVLALLAACMLAISAVDGVYSDLRKSRASTISTVVQQHNRRVSAGTIVHQCQFPHAVPWYQPIHSPDDLIGSGKAVWRVFGTGSCT
jgi:hypothetical protein